MAFIPVEKYNCEIVVKKSRFIGVGYPISSVEEAREILQNLKKEYSDSRHVCYGFLWGKNSTHMGMSDDGEPHGTAGMPILEVVKGSGYENIIVAVIRYFGGTKLGTGGLVKAYTEISQNVIKGIKVELYVERFNASLLIPYTMYNQVKILLEDFSCIILDEEFLSDIKINFMISKENEFVFSDKLKDLSKGSLSFTRL